MIKYLSLFSGIGAFESAMRNLNIEYELIGFSEIDKYATKSYCAIHNVSENKNLGDITKIDETKLPSDIDLLTYGFPCQDISIAGKQKGFFNRDGSVTRSGLFFDALRLIQATKPKIAIAENVKNLVSKKFKNEFASCSEWKSWLAIHLETSLAHLTIKGEESLKIRTEKAETRGCSITFGSKPSGLQHSRAIFQPEGP